MIIVKSKVCSSRLLSSTIHYPVFRILSVSAKALHLKHQFRTMLSSNDTNNPASVIHHPSSVSHHPRYISQAEAQRIDDMLMSDQIGYSLDVLMEMAGVCT